MEFLIILEVTFLRIGNRYSRNGRLSRCVEEKKITPEIWVGHVGP
jgi:hypothetical protein